MRRPSPAGPDVLPSTRVGAHRVIVWASLAVMAALLLAGCGRGGVREDPLMRLSAAESLVEGKSLMEREKYPSARRYLLHAFEVEPNSAQGREALLLAADCFFLDGGSQNWIQSEAKYRDFQNRFPTSPRSAYVQFQIGRSLAQRMEKPDRDQSTAGKALQAFEDLIRLFPTSEHAAEAERQIVLVRNNLAEHEYLVGYFYLRYGLPIASVGRFETLLEDYPDYQAPDKVLYHLGLAYQRMQRADEAAATFSRLRKDHPASPWLTKLPPVTASSAATSDTQAPSAASTPSSGSRPSR